jgi:choline kinase
MKAIALAAGIGGRMGPLTDHDRKRLLSVGDSTILGRIVDGLLTIEVREIVVVTGNFAVQVEAFLAERHPGLPFRFVHNARYRETNNIRSLATSLDSTAICR